ncbi:MAG: VTT domain-containing protein [Candidatus Parcubacteria bacterium]|nr:VTT domain-containing protein [Candidatus Parcubacteria bacterium]
MIASIEWLRVFIDHYPYLEYLVVFLGAAFGGELILLALGFLAAHNIVSIFPLIIFSFTGTLFSDTLWFFLGRTTFVKKIVTHRYANTTISVINKAVERVSKGNDLIALIIAKFLIGTRILLIMYVGTKIVKFKNFIRYDMVAIFLWLMVIIPIGFISGLGFTYFASILENVYAAVGFILLIIFLAIMLEIWLKNRFTKIGDEV